MSEFEQLREIIGAGPASDPARQQRQRAHLIASLRRRRSQQRVWFAVGGLATAAAAASAAWLVWPVQGPEPLPCWSGDQRVVDGSWIEAKEDARQLRFADGSETTLQAQARARLVASNDRAVRLNLESGRLRARVTHARRRAWLFEAGPFRVRVTGTKLAVGWDPAARVLDVEVSEGSVRVFGEGIPTAGLPVERNQRLRATIGERATTIQLARRHPPLAEASQTNETPQTQADVAPPRPRAKKKGTRRRSLAARLARWRQLARGGELERALDEADRIGWAVLLQRLGGWDLLLLADTARLAGRQRRAARVLRALRGARFSATDPARLAAFHLGRLAFEDQRNYTRAAQWFRRFLAEAPAHELAQDARGQLMLSLSRVPASATARQAAKDYLRRHPKGPYAAAAQAILEGAMP